MIESQSNFKFGAPIIFLSSIPVVLPNNEDVIVHLKPLTYKEIHSQIALKYVKEHSKDIKDIYVYEALLTPHIVSVDGIIGFPSISSFVSQMSLEHKRFLYAKLLEYSVVSEEQLESIESMLDVQFNPMFQDESWECKVCQEKKLDYSRGCGFLDKDKRDSSPLLPRVSGKRIIECPISSIDFYILNQASKVHTLWASGNLPEAGGIGDQTDWFVKVALLFKRKLSEAEQASIERVKDKTR